MSLNRQIVRKPKPRLEDEEQKAVVKFLKINFPKALYCASAGGMRTSMKQAIKMKAMGYVAGFPDLFIYEPNGMYSGLAIEMKRTKGGLVSEEQKEWLKRLNERNFKAVVCYGALDAINIICKYFKGEA